MNKILGYTYQDVITRFEGVAIGHVEYLTGCNQTLIVPRGSDSTKREEAEWFDDQRLIRLNLDRIILDNGSTPGFDAPAPKR